jgi:Fe-S cluster assembly protein SufB
MANDSAVMPRDDIGDINKYDFRTDSEAIFKARKGLDAEIVAQISEMKQEPEWMRDFRLRSLEIFEARPMPKWGGGININFQDIYYYLKPTESHQGDPGKMFRTRSKKPLKSWGFPKRSESSSRGEGTVRERSRLRVA